MQYGERVKVLQAGELLSGRFLSSITDFDGNFRHVVQLDTVNRYDAIELLTPLANLVSKAKADGVTMSLPTIEWRALGEERCINLGPNNAHAFAAMGHVDKIAAIKCLRSWFISDEKGLLPLRMAKEVIEALMVKFPR